MASRGILSRNVAASRAPRDLRHSSNCRASNQAAEYIGFAIGQETTIFREFWPSAAVLTQRSKLANHCT
jgi:hypothetical protein